MSFLLISGGFWSGLILLLQSAQAHAHLPAGTAGHCQPHIWLVPVGAGAVHVFKAVPVLLPQDGSCSQKCVACPKAFPPGWKLGRKMKQYLVVGLGEEEVSQEKASQEKALQVHLLLSESQDWQKPCLLVAITFTFCCNYREHLYFKNAALQAVYPQKQHMRYKKQLLHVHSSHLSPKAFQVCPGWWIHKAQGVPAVNPC